MDLAMDDGQSYAGPALLGCMARHPARASGAKTAAERMSSPAVSVTPDVSLRTATRLLQMHGIHHLPVVADGEQDDRSPGDQRFATCWTNVWLTPDRPAMAWRRGLLLPGLHRPVSARGGGPKVPTW